MISKIFKYKQGNNGKLNLKFNKIKYICIIDENFNYINESYVCEINTSKEMFY